MNVRRPLLLAALVATLPLSLVACGNKGPLVMPEDAESVIEPTSHTGLVPVEIHPDQTLPEEAPEGALADPTAVDPLLEPADEPAGEPAPGQASDPASDPRIPIDPATVPDSTPAETADDGDA